MSSIIYVYVYVLLYTGVGVKDEGMYVCVAQNQFGTNEASGYLTITGICKMGAASWENQQSAYAKTKTQISFADQRLCFSLHG